MYQHLLTKKIKKISFYSIVGAIGFLSMFIFLEIKANHLAEIAEENNQVLETKQLEKAKMFDQVDETYASDNEIYDLTIDNWTFGDEPSIPSANAKYGQVKFYYSSSLDGNYTSDTPTNAGTYYLKGIVEATSAYNGVESQPISFQIDQRKVTLIWNNDEVVYYNSEDQIDYITVYYEDIKLEKIYPNITGIDEFKDVGTYQVSVDFNSLDSNYQFENTSATYTMVKYVVTISNFEDISWLVGEDPILPNPIASNNVAVRVMYSTSKDGAYSYEVPSVAGVYYMKAYVEATASYDAVSEYRILTIKKIVVDVPPVDNNVYTFNGENIYYQIDRGSEFYSVTNYVKLRAGNYTLIVSLRDKNTYVWSNGSSEDLYYDFVINKLEISLVWNNDQNFVYNGTNQIDQIEVYYYDVYNNIKYVDINETSFINAGSYEFNADVNEIINYDFSNKTATYQMHKCDNIIEEIETYDWVYSEEKIFPKVITTYNNDDKKISYQYSLNENGDYSDDIPLNVGTYFIKVIVEASDNFNEVSTIASFKINPYQVTKPLKDQQVYYYDGEVKTYLLEANDLYSISENGDDVSQVDAGIYHLIIQLNDRNNYQWDDETNTDLDYEFIINKGLIALSEETKLVYLDDQEGNHLKIIGNYSLNDSPLSYDGKKHEVAIDFNIDGSKVQVYYLINNQLTLEKPQVEELGTYTFSYSLTNLNNYENFDGVFYITVVKGKIPKPETGDDILVYNGQEQIFVIEENALYTIYDNKQTDIGFYQVRVAINDLAHYTWDDDTSDDLLYIFGIVKDTNNEIYNLSIDDWEYGDEPSTPKGEAKYGEIIYYYASSLNGTYSLTSPTQVGLYYLKAIVEATATYGEAINYTTFNILKKNVVIPQQVNENYIYTGNYITYNLPKSSLYRISNNVKLNVGNYQVVVSLIDKSNCQWEDGTRDDLSYDFIINKSQNELFDVNITSWTYGDNPSSPSGKALFGVVRFSYSDTLDGEFTNIVPYNAGVYYLKAYVKGNDNYQAISEIIEFKIKKAGNDILDLTIDSWTYGESANLLSSRALFGTITYSYSSEKDGVYSKRMPTKAGTYYVKAEVIGNDNYEGAQSYLQFTIYKKVIEAPLINDTSYTYTGEYITYNLSSSDYYNIFNNVKLNAGSYQVILSLYDKDNYIWSTSLDSEDLRYPFVIEKAENEILTLSMSDYQEHDNPYSPSAEAKFGYVQFAYSENYDGIYQDESPSTIGTYYLKAYVKESNNYLACSIIISFEILASSEKTINQITWSDEGLIQALSLSGEVKYLYIKKGDDEFVEGIPLTKGEYYVLAYVDKGDEYFGTYELKYFIIE